MDTLVVMEDFIDPDLLRMLDDSEMESYERKFAMYGLRMIDFPGTTNRHGIMAALRPYIRGQVPCVRICPYPNLNLVRTTLSLVDFGTSGISVLVR